MRKERIICGAFVAAPGIVAVVIYALSPAAGATTSRTLHLFEHDTQQASLDLGGRGTNPGNLFVYSGDVFDHAGGSRLGRAAGYCMTMSANAHNTGEVFCTATFVLARGEIMPAARSWVRACSTPPTSLPLARPSPSRSLAAPEATSTPTATARSRCLLMCQTKRTPTLSCI